MPRNTWRTLTAAGTLALGTVVAGCAAGDRTKFTERELADIEARDEMAQTITPSAPTWPNGGTYTTTKADRKCADGTWPNGGCYQPMLGLGHALADTWPAGGY